MKLTLSEVKRRNKQYGHYFFEKGYKNYFKGYTYTMVYDKERDINFLKVIKPLEKDPLWYLVKESGEIRYQNTGEKPEIKEENNSKKENKTQIYKDYSGICFEMGKSRGCDTRMR
jgi:hypothetical protein